MSNSESYAQDLLELLTLHHQAEQLAITQREAKKQQFEQARRQLALFQGQVKTFNVANNVDMTSTVVELQLSLERQVRQCELDLRDAITDAENKRLLFEVKKQEIERKIADIQNVDEALQILSIGERIKKLEENLNQGDRHGIS